MQGYISVFLDDGAWQELLQYEPFPSIASLNDDVRVKLRTATLISLPAPRAIRELTLDVDQARQFEAWLVAVMGRADAPSGARGALAAVREGIRLAE